MKLSRKEAQRIATEYSLGAIKSFKPFSGGWVNYNYELETEKGSYVIRVLGLGITKDTKKRLASEFKVLSALHKNHFPYAIPYPLKNKNRSYLASTGKTLLWVYPKIKGTHIKHYNNKNIRSIACALATYHKYVKNIEITNNRNIDSPKKLLEKYKEMRKQKADSERNKLMLNNIDLFEKCLNKVKNINFNINKLPIHYDFHKGNLLFNKNKVVGILDFERMLYAPRMLDIAQLIKCTYDNGEKKFVHKVNLILNEYNKINSLTKKEKAQVLLMLAKDNCRMFERFYVLAGSNTFKSGKEGELSCLKWTIGVQKNVAGVLGWI